MLVIIKPMLVDAIHHNNASELPSRMQMLILIHKLLSLWRHTSLCLPPCSSQKFENGFTLRLELISDAHLHQIMINNLYWLCLAWNQSNDLWQVWPSLVASLSWSRSVKLFYFYLHWPRYGSLRYFKLLMVKIWLSRIQAHACLWSAMPKKYSAGWVLVSSNPEPCQF